MRKMMSLIVLIAIGLGFSGCGRTPLPGIPIQTILHHDMNKPVGVKILRIPDFNKINTAEVGGNLYSKSNQNLQNTYTVSSDGGTKAMLSNGDTINTFNVLPKHLNNRKLFKWEKTKNAVCYPLPIRGETKNLAICTIDIDNSGHFSVAGYNTRDKVYKLSNNVSYKIKPVPPLITEDSFKYTVLYQGKIGNKVKMTFREFYKNMNRASFTQFYKYTLTYTIEMHFVNFTITIL
ncbi:hypothetical protein OAR97_08180 [Arcobacteraceae bacterium]|nr:hypothetical protein [Arcobacteraceae bacterium]